MVSLLRCFTRFNHGLTTERNLSYLKPYLSSNWTKQFGLNGRRQTSSASKSSRDIVRISSSLILHQSEPTSEDAASKRVSPRGGGRLVILLAWLGAREKHISKYRDLYYKHQFDVLTVKTSPSALLFPTTGSQRIAIELFQYLKTTRQKYPNVVVHGFSVGAYQLAEMLVLMEENETKKRDVDANKSIMVSIKGMIYDSAVDADGMPYGFSKATIKNPALAKLVELTISVYLFLFHFVATRHYRRASKVFHSIPLRCPALLLVSHSDPVGTSEANRLLAEEWRKLGIDVSWKCWDDSRHVGHLQKYPDAYAEEVDSFLRKINLNGS